MSEKFDSIGYAKRGAFLPSISAAGRLQRNMVDAIEDYHSRPIPVKRLSREQMEAEEKSRKEYALGSVGTELSGIINRAYDINKDDRWILRKYGSYSRRNYPFSPSYIVSGAAKDDYDRIAELADKLDRREESLKLARHSLKNMVTFGGETKKVKKELGHHKAEVDNILDKSTLSDEEIESDHSEYNQIHGDYTPRAKMLRERHLENVQGMLQNPEILERVIKGARIQAQLEGVDIIEADDSDNTES
jgi:hypothetical protein